MKLLRIILNEPLGLLFYATPIVIPALFWFIVWEINKPVPACRELVAMSSTCIPFGCKRTYINERGEDTGECR